MGAKPKKPVAVLRVPPHSVTAVPPRIAIFSLDPEAIQRWTDFIKSLKIGEFLVLLLEATKPTARVSPRSGREPSWEALLRQISSLDSGRFRTAGVPSIEELMDLPIVQERCESIKAGHDNEMQLRLQRVLVPTHVGSKRKDVDPEDLNKARVLRIALTSKFQRRRRLGESWDRILHDELLHLVNTPHIKEFVERATAKGTNLQPSRLASMIAAHKYKVPVDRVRRGAFRRTVRQQLTKPATRPGRPRRSDSEVVRATKIAKVELSEIWQPSQESNESGDDDNGTDG